MNEYFTKAFMTAVAYLPDNIWRACYSLNLIQRESCEEIRLRLGKHPKALVQGKYVTLTDKGISSTVNKEDINFIIKKATKNSLHTYSEQIKNGYITTDEGHRLGLCGEVVTDGGNISTLRNISSINLRIAKPCYNFAENIVDYYKRQGVSNTLIISEAGDGKTSLLRELARRLSGYYSVVIVDERYEISGVKKEGKCVFDVGDCDVISGGSKFETINFAIRNMSPQIIIADEITNETDADVIKRVSYCGSKTIVSAHCSNINELYKRPIYKDLIYFNIFDTIIQIDRLDEVRNYRLFTSEDSNDNKNNRNGCNGGIILGNRVFYEQKL